MSLGFLLSSILSYIFLWGVSGGAIVLGKLPVPGVLLNWLIVGQGPRAYCACSGCGLLGHFYSRPSFLSSFFFSG